MNQASLFRESEKYFPTPLQQFQFFDKYARYDWDKGRRETWIETVDRSVAFLQELSNNQLPAEDYERIRKFILEMRAMPSMRLLAMAGPAARRNHISIYNCAYVAVDSIQSFVESLIISMSGCGVGYSVENQYINQIPAVASRVPYGNYTFKIEDSAEGWADALQYGLNAWMLGFDVKFDYSHVRPKGTILKTKGGRASGPEPLQELLEFSRDVIRNAAGRKLTAVECHDIMCMVGNAAVSGGVRRTALISLFDTNDDAMMRSKDDEVHHFMGSLAPDGTQYTENLNPQRANANNSGVWLEHKTRAEIAEYMYLMDSTKRGEPGIFSRRASQMTKPDRRKMADFGANPCCEIALKNGQFCNLSIVVARANDTIQSLLEKVEVATLIGTIQSMATDFKGMRPRWKENCEQERLLGVDITGQLDCPIVQDADVMRVLRDHAVAVNKRYAELLGISQSAAITCIKPGGNSSALLDVSSGLHARHSPYYIRNVRVAASSPLYKVLKASGVPLSPENGQTAENAVTWVAGFPVKSPDGAVTKDQRTALQQLDYWKRVKLNWCEHTASASINYEPQELEAIIDWIYENQDVISGLSFVPSSDVNYMQMPYETCTKEEYERAMQAFPAIDWAMIADFEAEDMTTASQELACFAGACEVSFA